MSSADKLTIQTPEQTSLEFPLAGIGSRFLALAIDYLLQAAGYWVLAMIAIAAFSLGKFAQQTGLWTIAAIVFIIFSVQFGYFALFETFWNGQTPGKRWTHLRVIKDSGRPISAYDAILRNLLRIVDMLPSLYATGLVTMLISRENKRVGDFAAGTVVVHEKPLEGLDSLWNRTASRVEVVRVAQGTQLNAEELRLIETFLDRRQGLEPDVRRSMALQIAARLGHRLNIPAETRPDSEQFLEALAEQRRSTARLH
jgi:uncharacterized RDD family membrane protein YckC